MSVKNSMMVDMKWTLDLLGATENASVGSSIKSEAMAFENILNTTTTIKIGLANRQISGICQS
jgi:hypothetical protein